MLNSFRHLHLRLVFRFHSPGLHRQAPDRERASGECHPAKRVDSCVFQAFSSRDKTRDAEGCVLRMLFDNLLLIHVLVESRLTRVLLVYFYALSRKIISLPTYSSSLYYQTIINVDMSHINVAFLFNTGTCIIHGRTKTCYSLFQIFRPVQSNLQVCFANSKPDHTRES